MAAAHVPRLAGQSADYLQKQLDDYADGTRDNPVMAEFCQSPERAAARPVRGALRRDVGAHLPPNAIARRRDAWRAATNWRIKAMKPDASPACNGCHGPDGIGVAHAAPYLAGQSAEYLAGALKPSGKARARMMPAN